MTLRSSRSLRRTRNKQSLRCVAMLQFVIFVICPCLLPRQRLLAAAAAAAAAVAASSCVSCSFVRGHGPTAAFFLCNRHLSFSVPHWLACFVACALWPASLLRPVQLNEPVRRAPKGVREQIGQFVSHPMEAPGPIKTLGAKSPGRDGGNGGGPWAPQMRFFFRKHTAGVNDCCIDPRGRFVATVSDDQSALVWSATTGQLVCSLSGGASARSEIRTCSFNPDGVLLATGSASGAIELWDASNASVASASGSSWPAYRALETAHAAAVNCVAWMPLRGSKTLLTVGDDKHLRWWECSTPHCATTCDFELRSAGNAVAASPVRLHPLLSPWHMRCTASSIFVFFKSLRQIISQSTLWPKRTFEFGCDNTWLPAGWSRGRGWL